MEKLSLRESWRAAPERVLRGEVEIWYKDFDGMAKKFLPPYGDGTFSSLEDAVAARFSPPYGDGTVVIISTSLSMISFRPLTGMVLT